MERPPSVFIIKDIADSDWCRSVILGIALAVGAMAMHTDFPNGMPSLFPRSDHQERSTGVALRPVSDVEFTSALEPAAPRRPADSESRTTAGRQQPRLERWLIIGLMFAASAFCLVMA